MKYDGDGSIIGEGASGEHALQEAASLARSFASQARSERTRQAYRWQWDRFCEWCNEHAQDALPAAPGTVAMYLGAGANTGLSVATLAQALAAISEAHRVAGHDSPRTTPVVRETWKGIRRAVTTAQRRVDPLMPSDLRCLVEATPGTTAGTRDRALLLVGFAGAFRRGELVALEVADLSFSRRGLAVRISRSKTDQVGAGESIGIPCGVIPSTCPVAALRMWLEAGEVSDGAVFRAVDRHGNVGGALAGRDIARIIKRSARAAGLDPSRYSGHSLRAGLATTAARAGKSDRAIMRQGRWSSRTMVDRYVREPHCWIRATQLRALGCRKGFPPDAAGCVGRRPGATATLGDARTGIRKKPVRLVSNCHESMRVTGLSIVPTSAVPKPQIYIESIGVGWAGFRLHPDRVLRPPCALRSSGAVHRCLGVACVSKRPQGLSMD